PDRAAGEQEQRAEGGGDDAGGVNGGLETDPDAGEHHSGGTGLGGGGHGAGRLGGGAGEVPGQCQDHPGEHDPDDHGQGGDQAGVTAVVGERLTDTLERPEAGRQVDEGGDRG